MKTAAFEYVLKLAQQTNILPVTSSCATGCIFCSHKNNPADIEAYSLPMLSFDEIKTMAEFLDGNKKIVIGESASRIIEGEPFMRRDMVDILKYLRSKYPFAVIEVTTSGTYLTEKIVKELKAIEPIEMNISLNSSSLDKRRLLHRGLDISGALGGVRYLKEMKVLFHGSIVAMPDIVGYKDIEDTIDFLCSNGARTVRMFVPGFSSLSEFDIDFHAIRKRLHGVSDSLYEKHGVPILVEPPEIRNLDAEIAGIMKETPASTSGLLKGDVILDIDGHVPVTRVDAYNMLYKSKNPSITIKRSGNISCICMKKQGGEPSGAVFYYDIHPDVIGAMEREAMRNRAKRPLVVTSNLAYPVIKLGIEKLADMDVDILNIRNSWFGGTIMCAGLLTVNDIIDGIQNHIQKNQKPSLIMVPSIPFDMNGRDLSGRHFHNIEDIVGVKTVLVEQS